VEENLAEDFRRYVQAEEKPFTGFLVKTFRTLKHIIQNWLGNELYINNLYYRINRGKLANIPTVQQEYPQNSIETVLQGVEEETSKFRTPDRIRQEVVKYYFDHIHKRQLSDYQIA